jgi:hypothetical protein
MLSSFIHHLEKTSKDCLLAIHIELIDGLVVELVSSLVAMNMSMAGS